MSLVQVENLRIAFGSEGTKEHCREVVHGVSFSIKAGEIFGLVGESGSGKSVTSLSLLHLLPMGAEIHADRMDFAGKNLLKQSEKEWQDIRGNQISIVFQEPMTSLNPVLTIEKQVEEGLLLHEPQIYKKNKELRRKRVLEVLSEANLKHPEELLSKYPHQLSGGMRQRVMIAMAMLCRPKLLIADEPTTALDAATEEAVLELLSRYRKEYGTAILFISHDLALVRRLCDRVAVVKDGCLVEQGETERLFRNPEEEYTKQLLSATETVLAREEHKETEELLRLTNAGVSYREKTFLGKEKITKAVQQVSFSLHRGEILGLVGESGSGKSTISKAVTGLLPLTEGDLWISKEAGRPQMVFQDPYGSLNPAKKIKWILEEPLKIQGGFSKKERKRLVMEALKEVELEEVHLNRYVRELSGGQRQRVAIAAALIQKPDVVVLDEPVSALDVTVQHQILELLYRLKQERSMSYLFVSHDMNVIRKLCDRVMILYHGELVEEGRTEEVFLHPKHPYTKELIETRGAGKSYAEGKEGKEKIS